MKEELEKEIELLKQQLHQKRIDFLKDELKRAMAAIGFFSEALAKELLLQQSDIEKQCDCKKATSRVA